VCVCVCVCLFTIVAGIEEKKSSMSPDTSFDGDQEASSATMGNFLPLDSLGDRHVLAQIVAETQAGMSSIEQSNLLKLEQEHLQAVIDDMEKTASALNDEIQDKQTTLQSLKNHCEDARK
jgi:hypothetical protein